jgi:hypothetical protein
MYPTLVKETSHLVGKAHVIRSRTYALKQENSNPMWKIGMLGLYLYNLAGAKFIFSYF